MKRSTTIKAFILLGKFIDQFSSAGFLRNRDINLLNEKFADSFSTQIKTAGIYNPWFTEDFVRYALGAVASSLTEEKIDKWLSAYSQLDENIKTRKIIGLVLAGNIPLVGFHDIITVIMSGHTLLARLSSKDDKLFPALKEILCYIDPGFYEIINFSDTPLKNFDAVIATGSNNTSRYFDYYFGKYPNIIRKNRNSVAVLNGAETKDDLVKLADDVFLYFGLGCRNVSKIFIPEGYDISNILKQFEHYSYLYNHNKYTNNYSYYKAIYLIDMTKHLDNGFLLMKEDSGYASPVGVLYYERYNDPDKLQEKLQHESDLIQCVVSGSAIHERSVHFGTTQLPDLWNYADNIDTMKFLINLYKN